jgi:16S rRNA (adenine1518-N6/adenine1519-N6)-dimethyltransferase
MRNFDYKKSLGQNFLKDNNVISKIVNAPELKENNLVIEIGPGAGALSTELVKKYDRVLMYEIDTRLKSILEEKLSDYDNYEIIFDDFLNRDVLNDIKKYHYDNLYIIANIPYYVTTPIVLKIIKENIPINEMVIMIQKEVADRFSSAAGTKEYGQITVLLQYFFEIEKVCNVSKNCFEPIPKVDSTVLKLKTNKKYDVKDEEKFYKLLKDAFRQKRKNLRNNLNNYDLEKIKNVLLEFNKDLTCRAEELKVEEFAQISNEL